MACSCHRTELNIIFSNFEHSVQTQMGLSYGNQTGFEQINIKKYVCFEFEVSIKSIYNELVLSQPKFFDVYLFEVSLITIRQPHLSLNTMIKVRKK